MKLLPRPERLIEQEDFEAMSAYHEDSLQRHQRTTESKKQFRRRIRQMIKKERANGKQISKIPCLVFVLNVWNFKILDPTYISAKEQRRLDRQELRAMLKTEMVLEDKNKIDPVYEDESE